MFSGKLEYVDLKKVMARGESGTGMSVKKLVVVTIVWTVLSLGVGVYGIWYIVQHRIPGVRAEERSARLGAGLGVLMCIGYAAIWLPFAAKIGRKRRLEREARKNAKRSSRSRAKRSRQ